MKILLKNIGKKNKDIYKKKSLKKLAYQWTNSYFIDQKRGG